MSLPQAAYAVILLANPLRRLLVSALVRTVDRKVGRSRDEAGTENNRHSRTSLLPKST